MQKRRGDMTNVSDRRYALRYPRCSGVSLSRRASPVPLPSPEARTVPRDSAWVGGLAESPLSSWVPETFQIQGHFLVTPGASRRPVSWNSVYLAIPGHSRSPHVRPSDRGSIPPPPLLSRRASSIFGDVVRGTFRLTHARRSHVARRVPLEELVCPARARGYGGAVSGTASEIRALRHRSHPYADYGQHRRALRVGGR